MKICRFRLTPSEYRCATSPATTVIVRCPWEYVWEILFPELGSHLIPPSQALEPGYYAGGLARARALCTEPQHARIGVIDAHGSSRRLWQSSIGQSSIGHNRVSRNHANWAALRRIESYPPPSPFSKPVVHLVGGDAPVHPLHQQRDASASRAA